MFRKLLSAGLAAALLGLASPVLAADKLTVILDWFVNPDHAPLVIAKEGGFFAKEGLDVDIIAPAESTSPPKLVAAGKADIAVYYQPDLMLLRKEGLPLIRFGTLIETPLNCLIALQDGPIKTLADLKGHKIGVSEASMEGATLDTILGAGGLTTKDVTLVNVNYNLVTSLMSGQVDAVIDGYRNFELIQLGIEGHPAIAFYPEEHGEPPYDELIYVANESMRSDPRLVRFIDAVQQATIFLTNHPDDALAMFVKAYPDLDDKLNRAAWAATLPRLAKRPGALDVVAYQRFAEFMKSEGLIDTVPPVDSYAIEPK